MALVLAYLPCELRKREHFNDLIEPAQWFVIPGWKPSGHAGLTSISDKILAHLETHGKIPIDFNAAELTLGACRLKKSLIVLFKKIDVQNIWNSSGGLLYRAAQALAHTPLRSLKCFGGAKAVAEILRDSHRRRDLDHHGYM